MKITLRNPVPGDIGWLISIHGELYAEQFNFDSNFEVDIAKKVVGFLENSAKFNKIWIAQVGTERVGSIAISLRQNQTAFINFLLVKREYRGYGIAKQLMDKAIYHSQKFNINLIRLETYSCLKDARNLYKKYGFEPYDVRPNLEKYGQSFDQEFWERRL
jgi:ribosomal protein S18 acetylase RimI-like enzyme